MTGLRTLLVEGAALAPVSLSPLPTLLAGCSTKAREDVVTGGVSGTLALHLEEKSLVTGYVSLGPSRESDCDLWRSQVLSVVSVLNYY